MMHVSPSERTGYWLQLALAVGIATMGLVLDSGAVVIAAMLVAPLMTPIVNLGMGLAIGSPLLVIRSSVRVLLSTAIAIGSAALIVRSLPFEAITSEIAARTTPTVLDLITASFCALAGVYAAMRPSSEVASTAAGTSIGISLVPPLCTCGYGLGAADARIASGAGLLFVTNLVAIVVVGTLSFSLFGFTRVDTPSLEHEVMEQTEPRSRVAKWARRIAGRSMSRGAVGLRLVMPLALLAIVIVPLIAAFNEVAWEIHARKGVERAVAMLDVDLLETRIRIEHHGVEVSIVLIGTTADAENVRKRLDEDIRELSGTPPRVAVYALPDATAFAGLQDALRRMPPPSPVVPVVEPPPPPPPPPPEPSPSERLGDALTLVDTTLVEQWPTRALGKILMSRWRRRPDERVGLEITHQGPPLDDAARELLEASLGDDLGRAVIVEDRAIPALPLSRGENQAAWAIELALAIESARPIETMWLCVEMAPTPTPTPDPMGELVLAAVSEFPRVRKLEALDWSVRFAQDGCEVPPP